MSFRKVTPVKKANKPGPAPKRSAPQKCAPKRRPVGGDR